MKKTTILLLFFCMTLSASGEVSTKVCLSDGNTPLELADPNIPFVYRDIMVGTKLTITVDSNAAAGWWYGSLVIEEDMNEIGRLYGRGYDGYGYPGSCLPAAGEFADVWETVELGYGFEFNSDEATAGDWFIFDYNALDIGDCNVAFYYLEYGEPPELIHTIMFHHVRTRDFNGDSIVNFADFAVLASYWQEDCGDANDCKKADIYVNNKIDVNDLMLFCKYWLEETE